MSENPQETADLAIFTEEIFNGKLHFLLSETLDCPFCKIFGTFPYIFNTGYKI